MPILIRDRAPLRSGEDRKESMADGLLLAVGTCAGCIQACEGKIERKQWYSDLNKTIFVPLG